MLQASFIDQLEGVNTPRSRAVEAQKLVTKFAEFLRSGPAPSSNPMSDESQLYQEADSIQKLHLIAQELPAGGKFDKAREVAQIMSHFKGYSQCVDAFIEQSQMAIFLGLTIIGEVLTNPDQVMSKFVLRPSSSTSTTAR